MPIDEKIDQMFREDNPTGEAVKSLITVNDRVKGKGSEVELKTDLTDDEVKLHTVLESLGLIIELGEENFSKQCFLLNLVEKKERKALSKNRMSRSEIVQVARHPDQMMMPGMEQQNPGMVKRFFMRKRNQGPP